MKNIEKYKDEIEAKIRENSTLDCAVCSLRGGVCNPNYVCTGHHLESLDWLLKEYKEPIKPILTEKEKAYLKNVIEPKRDEIIYIKKTGVYKSLKADCCCVSVYLKNPFCNKDTIFVSASTPWTLLDFLTTKDMSFEGMVMNKRYTLEELGL